MPTTLIVVDSTDTQADVERQLISDTGNRLRAGSYLHGFVKRIVAGWRPSKVYIGVNAGKATGTVTLASHVATDTVTINGVVFTCVASGATGNQYNVGGSDSITGDNLAAAINASVTALVSGYVTAANVAGVVTITAAQSGLSGNMFTLAISAHGSVSGAKLTGGDNGATQRTHFYGSGS